MVVERVCAEPRHFLIQLNTSNRFELHVFKTGLYQGKFHTLLFPDYRGTAEYDPQRPETSRIELTLVTKAIKCVDTWLSTKDLKSVQEYAIHNMLAADQYPEIHFTSSEVHPLGPNHFDVRGTLTIRGIARPSSVDVTLQQESEKALIFRGTASVRLNDYGLKPPKALLGTIGTKNEMEFSFILEAEIAALPIRAAQQQPGKAI
jgi:polyisoprenoid-binding protein YceI